MMVDLPAGRPTPPTKIRRCILLYSICLCWRRTADNDWSPPSVYGCSPSEAESAGRHDLSSGKGGCIARILKRRTDITAILLSIRLPQYPPGKWTGLKRPSRGPFPKDRGFTLLDLIIVVIILGVLAMMIVPQFGSMISEARINDAAWELVSGLEYAESLAIE